MSGTVEPGRRPLTSLCSGGSGEIHLPGWDPEAAASTKRYLAPSAAGPAVSCSLTSPPLRTGSVLKDLQKRRLQTLVRWQIVRYARVMSYLEGGGLTAAERARRKQLRLAAAVFVDQHNLAAQGDHVG
jgi:hypothetical protein